jgi:geranylgeranylglycerol-phosphate geranylgeranyltransferase
MLADYLRIVRPLNCAMAAFGTFIGYCIGSGLLQFQKGIGIAMLVAFLVCAGGMVINDYFDRNIDRKLHPEKPIPSGRVSEKAALVYSMLLFLAGNLLAFYFLPGTSFGIAAGFTFLLIAYSAVLSKAKFLGNWVVASGTAFTLLFGASLVGSYYIAGFLAVAALFANLGREVTKDLEDLEADRGFKKTLPMLAGLRKVECLIFFYYLLAILFVYVPVVLLSFQRLAFVLLVSVANFAFLYSFRLVKERDYARSQVVSKGAMFLALISFLLGAI